MVISLGEDCVKGGGGGGEGDWVLQVGEEGSTGFMKGGLADPDHVAEQQWVLG